MRRQRSASLLHFAGKDGMRTPLPALIFDLDGTILDSRPGIVDCLQRVIDAYKIAESGPLDRFIGPPAEVWTAELLPDASENERLQLASDYRELYGRDGWRNCTLFAGVTEMLAQLRNSGYSLYVCTSKHQSFADKILDYLQLADSFVAIHGDRSEYADHRKSVLLARLVAEHDLCADSAWMIGDRIFDLQAAQANQMRCMAVGWGYGPAEELSLADALAATPADLFRMLMVAEDNTE